MPDPRMAQGQQAPPQGQGQRPQQRPPQGQQQPQGQPQQADQQQVIRQEISQMPRPDLEELAFAAVMELQGGGQPPAGGQQGGL